MSFRQGNRVSVGLHTFEVDVAARRLVSAAGDVFALSHDNANIAPGVVVRVADAPVLPGLVLTFTAPPGTLIQLNRTEGDE
jgi:hypothetical protein